MTPERWLQVAGVGTWFATTLPVLGAVLGGRLRGADLALWVSVSAAFLLAFCGMCWWPAARRRPAALALVAVQSASALALVALARDSLAAAALLVVVSAQLLAALPTTGAALWILGQTAALVAVFSRFTTPLQAATVGIAYGGFQLFALGAAALVVREQRAREALAAVNAELQATRALVAENSRVAERLRISRDLHDTLGHHLTALSLQLDVASRLAGGAAAEHVSRAHAVTKLLLADVRDVVGQLREGSRFDVVGAVRALAHSSTGRMAVHVEAPDVIPVDDEAQAHALFRCLQEIVTNAARHAQASNLWLTVEPRADGVVVRGRDDGRGAAAVTWGHGLTGMRERFEALDGRLEIATREGCGFEVRGFMPRAQAAS